MAASIKKGNVYKDAKGRKVEIMRYTDKTMKRVIFIGTDDKKLGEASVEKFKAAYKLAAERAPEKKAKKTLARA